MKTNIFRYVTILVLLLLLVSSCAPLPTPSSSSSNPPPQSNSPSQSSSSSGNNSTTTTNWQEFLTVEPFVGCIERVLPIAIDSSGNVEQQIENTNPIGTVRENWAIVPYNSGALLFTLTSMSDGDWIQINKSLVVDVSANANVPQHVDVIHSVGCGGTGQLREFPSTNLRSDLNSFSQKSTFAGADFFTLQPGEFEIFYVPFDCKSPGYYDISVTVEYSYQGENGVIEFPTFDALCPQSFTVYTTEAGGDLLGVENFDWKNGKYSQTP